MTIDSEQTLSEQPAGAGADDLRHGAAGGPAPAAGAGSGCSPQAPASGGSQDEGGEGNGGDDNDGEATQVEGDLDELVAVAAQRDQYLALAQRTQADFENYRKRVARESALAQARGIASLAKELLPALDNLDRALEEASAAGEEDALLQGVRLVRSELAAGLARVGIASFSPLGEAFDPAVHEAMATMPTDGEAASGTVVEVYQPGYRLGEGIIRPARVVVAA
jgi:molecular chaperone GrpE